MKLGKAIINLGEYAANGQATSKEVPLGKKSAVLVVRSLGYDACGRDALERQGSEPRKGIDIGRARDRESVCVSVDPRYAERGERD